MNNVYTTVYQSVYDGITTVHQTVYDGKTMYFQSIRTGSPIRAGQHTPPTGGASCKELATLKGTL
jgi:hypothetical protein